MVLSEDMEEKLQHSFNTNEETRNAENPFQTASNQTKSKKWIADFGVEKEDLDEYIR
ncbi:MAG: hypothetical protein LBH43_00390 [Treponema sp.]|jgi:hypothetical protein|nr:hypothetical protein [Treponema sp.]